MRIGNLLAICLLAGACLCLAAGCISGPFGRSAGGELVWFCDRCGEEIGHPTTHVCGLTELDEASGKDIPRAGVPREELIEILRDRERESAFREDVMAAPEGAPASSSATPPPEEEPAWKVWR